MEVNVKDKFCCWILKGFVVGIVVVLILVKLVWVNIVMIFIVVLGQGFLNFIMQCFVVFFLGYYKNYSGWLSYESFYYIFGGDLIGIVDIKISIFELCSVML